MKILHKNMVMNRNLDSSSDAGDNDDILMITVKWWYHNKYVFYFRSFKAGGCDSVFRATCPWDTAGMTNIAMKLMASQVMLMMVVVVMMMMVVMILMTIMMTMMMMMISKCRAQIWPTLPWKLPAPLQQITPADFPKLHFCIFVLYLLLHLH